jgi:hypothetical protein
MSESTPAAHDADGIADPHEFGQIRADEKDGFALRGQLAHQPVDLGFAADIDASRRLIQEQNPGLVMQQSADGDLLLIAAGEFGGRLAGALGADIEFFHPTPGGLALAA